MGRKVAPRQKCHSPGDRDNVTITNIWVMSDVDVLFPACALEGSGRGDVFAQGCFAVRNRLQPSASIRNRSHLSPYGRTIGDCWRRCHFWMLETTCNAFLYVRCGTSWHVDVFDKVSKSFCATGAILLSTIFLR